MAKILAARLITTTTRPLTRPLTRFIHTKSEVTDAVDLEKFCFRNSKKGAKTPTIEEGTKLDKVIAAGNENSTYILTWNGKFPTPQNHHGTNDKFYYTWNNSVGNLVYGTEKNNPRFKLDGGEMDVGLRLRKGTDERSISINFHLTSGKKRRVKFISSLSKDRKVLWQKERTEELEVAIDRKDGWTGGHINDLLPSHLPSNILVKVKIIEWEPNEENEERGDEYLDEADELVFDVDELI